LFVLTNKPAVGSDAQVVVGGGNFPGLVF